MTRTPRLYRSTRSFSAALSPARIRSANEAPSCAVGEGETISVNLGGTGRRRADAILRLDTLEETWSRYRLRRVVELHHLSSSRIRYSASEVRQAQDSLGRQVRKLRRKRVHENRDLGLDRCAGPLARLDLPAREVCTRGRRIRPQPHRQRSRPRPSGDRPSPATRQW